MKKLGKIHQKKYLFISKKSEKNYQKIFSLMKTGKYCSIFFNRKNQRKIQLKYFSNRRSEKLQIKLLAEKPENIYKIIFFIAKF